MINLITDDATIIEIVDIIPLSNIFFGLAILLTSGILTSIILEKIKIPHISSYVIGGVLVGQSAFNFIPSVIGNVHYPFTQFGLGIIAFVIGMEFHYSTLKGSGFRIPFITFFQVISTILFVTLGLMLFNFPFGEAFIVGTIASATAPASIIIIIKAFNIRQSKIKNILLPIVALDDAISIIAFGIASALFVTYGQTAGNSLFVAIQEILLSVGAGIGIGLGLGLLAKIKKGYSEFLIFSIAATFFGVAFSLIWHGSVIIILMIAGMIFTNLIDKEKYLIYDKSITKFTPPIFVLFYTLAGLNLRINLLLSSFLLVLSYIVFRSIGKILGCYIATSITKEPTIVKKNLGFAMLPQSGVAIGLSLLLPNPLKEKVLPIILGAVLFFELVSPQLIEKVFLQEKNLKMKSKKNIDPDYNFAIGSTYKQKSKRNIFIRAWSKSKKDKNKKEK